MINIILLFIIEVLSPAIILLSLYTYIRNTHKVKKAGFADSFLLLITHNPITISLFFSPRMGT